MNIVYISAYFCSKYDYNKITQLDKDNFDYIKNYYNSILQNNLKCVIFFDDMSKWFVEQYKTNNIKFIYPLSFDKITKQIKHLHDERFFYFKEYIEKTDIDWLLISDIADVVIINPVDKIIDIDDNTLYIGKEGENILNNEWFAKTYLQTNLNPISDYKDVFNNKIMYNCGAIFGHRNIMWVFLDKVCDLLLEFYNKMDSIKHPLDMLVINYVAHKYYSESLYQGDNFTTEFAQNIYDTNKAIKHK